MSYSTVEVIITVAPRLSFFITSCIVSIACKMAFDQLKTVLCLVFGSCALLFNLLLAFIILTVKCAHIGPYKWLLFLYTLSAIFSSIAELLTLMHLFINSYGYIFYDSLRILPPYISDGVLMVYGSCFRQDLMLLTICFIYRYYAVCNPTKLDCFLKNWINIALVFLAVSSVETGAMLYTEKRSARYEELMDPDFINTTGISLTETGYLAGIAFGKSGLSMKMLFQLWIYLIVSTCAGFIMINLAVKIAKALKNGPAISLTVTKLQRKVFTLLIVQLILPILCNVVPQQIIIFSLYFHFDCRSIVRFLCCCFPIAHVLDPLVTVLLISPYKKALLKKLCRFKARTNHVSFTDSATHFS